MKVGKLFRERISNLVKEGVNTKSNTFVVTWSGIPSAKMDSLRKDLKRKKANVLISKTSIARLALKESNFEELSKRLNGQIALISSDSDASEVSKIIVKYVKDFEGFVLQGGLLKGETLSAAQVQTLSDLPSREVLLSKFIGTLQAPVTRFAGALNAKSRDFVSILKQKSESSG